MTLPSRRQGRHDRRASLRLAILALALVLGPAWSMPPLQAWQPSPLQGIGPAGSAPGAVPAGWPADAQSTTGPTPPPGIERGEQAPPSPQAEVVLADVPAYIWVNGCGPTAAGMVLGYWDGQGRGGLVGGSAATQTAAVDAMISSAGNWDDYCLPIDYSPVLLPDRSEPPAGDEHADDCVADLMKTSQSHSYNYYGWSWFSDVDDAFQGYVALVAPQYTAAATNQLWGSFTWAAYRAEIDGGRPVVLLVDTDGNGSTDHFVTAIGYSDEGGTNMYACRNTWDGGVHWYQFAQMAAGQPWGIFGATLFRISPPEHQVFLPVVLDQALAGGERFTGRSTGRGGW